MLHSLIYVLTLKIQYTIANCWRTKKWNRSWFANHRLYFAWRRDFRNRNYYKQYAIFGPAHILIFIIDFILFFLNLKHRSINFCYSTFYTHTGILNTLHITHIEWVCMVARYALNNVTACIDDDTYFSLKQCHHILALVQCSIFFSMLIQTRDLLKRFYCAKYQMYWVC